MIACGGDHWPIRNHLEILTNQKPPGHPGEWRGTERHVEGMEGCGGIQRGTNRCREAQKD